METVKNETIGDGSSYDTEFVNCKFKKYNPKNYVSCKFLNCSFPMEATLGLSIFKNTENTYEKCTYNLEHVIKHLFGTTNGLTDIINGFNKYLNKSKYPDQIVDIGRVKNNDPKLVAI